jgi:hypothetical protein
VQDAVTAKLRAEQEQWQAGFESRIKSQLQEVKEESAAAVQSARDDGAKVLQEVRGSMSGLQSSMQQLIQQSLWGRGQQQLPQGAAVQPQQVMLAHAQQQPAVMQYVPTPTSRRSSLLQLFRGCNRRRCKHICTHLSSICSIC